ncbi:DUF2911 domain-containing protein [Mucilaginibacter sp. dw_454]|uniref:DUF2911 domain-containing protein n=1 Tax=Mucilaginibacter sp. dw_454 TaxID=2720079 RepID=UPI001BD31F70|nr:DUF2911 domain-containing protein [Mucilaginibacter sp. dw_454]
MKKAFLLKAIAGFAVALLISTVSFAQKKAPLSPRDSTSGVVHGAHISINYGAPSVRNRKIYGGLVPFDKTWRAGANEATTFTTDKNVTIGGKTLPAGKYSVFATPGQKEWKIIFNSQLGEWGIKNNGDANDDPAKDVVVATVTPKSVPMTERMKYTVTKTGFDLVWETTAVSVTVK